ncbi:MAG: arylsulfotransferase family protein [Aquihabitans sp.]
MITTGAALAVAALPTAVAAQLSPVASEAAPVEAFPAPGSQTADPATSITLTGAPASDIGAVSATGSGSGRISGTLRALPDGKGVVFDPSRDLQPGETVTVEAASATVANQDAYTFTVGTPAEHPGLQLDDEATGAPATAGDAPDRFTSRPDLLPPGITISTPSTTTSDGLLFTTPRADAASGSDQGIHILDDQGETVWFHPVTAPDVVSGDAFVDRYLGKPALLWFEGKAPYGPGSYRGEWVAVDQSYQEIARIRMGNGYQADIHDLFLTDDGTAYLMAYNPLTCTGTGAFTGCPEGTTVLDGVLQEVDLTTGAVLWEWHSLDHVPLSASVVAPEAGLWDYFHVNSVALDVDGNVLISSRNASADYKVSRATGNVIWAFGGATRPESLTIIGDSGTVQGPDFAHHLRALGNGTYSYFDNGNRRGYSRGAIVKVDEGAKTITYQQILRSTPDQLGPSQGTMQTLPSGHHLVAWGGLGTATEFDAAGNPGFRFRLSGASYRIYRFAWTGAPAAPPDLVSKVVGSNLSVAVSWNGDTRTATWRVRTGASASTMQTAATVDRTGFETTATVPNARYLAVEALDADGTVIGRTETKRSSAWFQAAPAPAVNGTYKPVVGDFAGSRNDDVIYYAPGAAKDFLHVSDGNGGFTSIDLPAVNGTYTPLVGDFVGDDRDEVLYTAKGSTTAYLVRFDQNARSAAPVVTSAPIAVPATVTTAFVLPHRAMYGGPHAEVFWYAAGSAADRIDAISWPVGGTPTRTSRSVSVGGTYQPIVGDFDGNGYADVFWYAPGPAADTTWFLAGNGTRSESQLSRPTPVSGSYQVLTGNFVGDPATDEVLFNQPGVGADSLWSLKTGIPSSRSVTSGLAGTGFVLEGGVDRVMSWTPGKSPSIWTFDPTSTTQPSGNDAVASGYQPVIGDFAGAGGTSSVLWYAPGTAAEVLYRGD